MRMISIWLLAFGIGTLVACGSAEVTTGGDEDKAEEADKGGEDKAEEEEAKEEEEKAEEGDKADGGEAAEPEVEMVCCDFTNKKGDKVKRTIKKVGCTKMKGKELAADQCPPAKTP